jgi:hypothetical protein
MLGRHVGSTFNAVTVDSDTSTSDTLMVFATGAAAERGAGAIQSASDPRARSFSKALADLMEDLAIQIVRDGEGARKQVEITVTGAASPRLPGVSPVPSPIRLWSRPQLPERMPTGAALSWPSARPAKRPSATSWRSGSGMSGWPSMASAIPPTAKPRRRTS